MPPWTAPARTDPPFLDAERPALEAWLEFHRATLLLKCAGLSAEQLATRSVPPSTLSLLGLVRHMTEVERSWFRRGLAGEDVPPLYYTDDNEDGDFDDTDPARADDDLAAFEARAGRRARGRRPHASTTSGTSRARPARSTCAGSTCT